MIISFNITNYKKESMLLTLKNPFTTGIVVAKVTGIGPEKARISTTEVANSDVAIFNNARREIRNIVFSLRPYECENHTVIERTRENIYNYFALKEKIRITCNTTEKNIYVDGYVESVEPNIFENQEIIDISIICPDGIWKGEKAESFILGSNKLFEFPFSNEINNVSYYAKWKDGNKFTWDIVYQYGWTWDNIGSTLGKLSSLYDRYQRLLLESPIDRDKVNTIVEEMYELDPENYLNVYPIN